MKRVLLASAAFLLGVQSISAQGWIGNSTNNSLFPVNSSLGLTPLSIGIGTNAPSAQLHTTGTVRFGGLLGNNTLNRVLVSDENGNLSFRDASSLPATGNFWGLTGNAITTGQFLGTTNDQLLDIRTNNVRRMTILGATPSKEGFVGLSVNDPLERLDVNGNIAVRGGNIRSVESNLTLTADGYNNGNSGVFLKYTGMGGVYTVAKNYPQWGYGAFSILGPGYSQATGFRISYASDPAGGVDNTISIDKDITRFSKPVEFTAANVFGPGNSSLKISAPNANNIILNSTSGGGGMQYGVIITDNYNNSTAVPPVSPTATPVVYGNIATTMGFLSINNSSDATKHHLRIQSSGDVELGQKLLVGNVIEQRIRLWRESGASNVYFPNLPTGSGKVLVWNEATGQVTVAPTAVANIAPPTTDNALQGTIDAQNAKIAKLENALASLQQRLSVLDNTNKNEAKLFQNVPNPSSQNTVINFSLPKDAKSAKLMVYNLQGEQLKSYTLNERGEGKIEIVSGELKAGMYVYALVVDGDIIDSKKMILTNQ